MQSKRTSPLFVLLGTLLVSVLQDVALPQTVQGATQTLRTWTDKSGNFRIEAMFLELKDDTVKLRRGDGVLLNVPLSKLCDADQQFVRKTAPRPPADENPFAIASEDKARESRIVLHEDFSKFEKGDLPNWGEGVHVELGLDGRKWLAPSKEGIHHVSQKIKSPLESWYLEFDFTAQVRKEPGGIWGDKGVVTSGISVADEQGNLYRMGWQIDARKHVFVFPDGGVEEFPTGVAVPAEGRKKADAIYWLTGKTLRIEKKGEILTISVNGRVACSNQIRGFSRLVRFEVDASLRVNGSGAAWPGLDNDHEWICFTNFKVCAL
jgi:hypothetical protein